MTWLERKSK